MKQRLLFVYNPHAGKGKLRTKLSEVVELFSEADYEVICYPTKFHLDAKQTVMHYVLAGGCDRIVCSGGDGTLSEAAGGLMEAVARIKRQGISDDLSTLPVTLPPLGYIPTGTTNDFAHSLKIPAGIREAAELAATGIAVANDIGQLNQTYFTYSAAFGLFTDVTYETPQNMKNALGRMAYILNGATKIVGVKSYHMRVETEEKCIEDTFIYGMIANSSWVGGFRGITGKQVELNDGLFEMILIRMPKDVLELQKIINALLTNRVEESPYIYYERVARLRIYSEENIPWTLDGDYGGTITNADVTIHKQAISYVMGD